MMTPTIGVTTDDFLSYPMAHNRLPFLREVTLDGIDPELGSVDVDISVTDLGSPVTRSFSTVVDVSSGFGLIKEPSILLDPAAMSRIEERRPADLVVTVRSAGDTLTEYRQTVHLLAARHWIIGDQFPNISLELLASFVMPNDPSLNELLAETRERLARTTGSGSTEGYQADADRVDSIVEAVYETARARGIRYSNPPASWDAGIVETTTGEVLGLGGQKIRTPSEVFDLKVGTCLDTTVALASALEHVGINSLLWVVKGHAFLAYWRQDGLLPSTAATDPSAIVNYIDLGALRVIETTRLTSQDDGASFASAAHQATRNEFLSGDMSEVIAAVDVRRARRNDILPLPSVRSAENGTTQVVEYVPTVHSGEHRVNAEEPEASSDGSDAAVAIPTPPRVRRWKNSLLDLSLRNKLINFTDRGVVQLAVPTGSLAHAEDRLNANQSIALIPSDDVDDVQRGRGIRFGSQLPQDQLRKVLDDGALFSDVTAKAYLTRMRGLAYKARTIVEETGANNLYVALGSLHWNIDGRPLKSPIILLPITLSATGRSSVYRIKLDESGTSTPNTVSSKSSGRSTGFGFPPSRTPSRTSTESTSTRPSRRSDVRSRRRASPTASRRPRTSRSCSSPSSGCGRTSMSTGRR